jgi:membrane fusion protein, multidrug efflux system
MRPFHRITLLFCTLSVFALTACNRGEKSDGKGENGKSPDKNEEVKIPVEVASVKREAIQARFQGTAALEAEAVAQVVAKAGGVILNISIEEGQTVGRGQVLAVLENDRQRLQLAQSSATLRKLQNDLKRQNELFERKLIGSDVYERVKFDVENAKASFDLAALELSYTEIRAPIAGTVSQRLVKLGNQINIGQTLFRIDDFDPLEARVAVPEREMQSIVAGQQVQMLVDAMPGKVFLGKVGRVSPVVDPKTGTFDVIAQFQDASQSLRSGMFGRVNITTAVHDNAMVIPRIALISEDGNAAVYTVNAEQRVMRKPVKIGLTGDGKSEILDGLTDADRVITLGQNAIREGSLVTVIGDKPVAKPESVKPEAEAPAAVAKAQ